MFTVRYKGAFSSWTDLGLCAGLISKKGVKFISAVASTSGRWNVKFECRETAIHCMGLNFGSSIAVLTD